MLTTLFWIFLGVIIYSYFGYTILLWLLSLIKKHNPIVLLDNENLPEVSLVIAAYNEADILDDKVQNSLALNYPKNKIKHVWITDGSTDGSEQVLAKYSELEILHQKERQGKMAAINRAMQHVTTSIAVFCDANTMLHQDAIKWLTSSIIDEKHGCVAGEKRIVNHKSDNAAGAGEGFYWNYESLIKKLESNVGSTVGAAGELYAVKTDLFQPPSEDTVIDDFVVAFNIAKQGYRIVYQPNAIAEEEASVDIKEEKKRKIRIAAGSFKVLFGYPELLNIFKFGFLSFQYLSHKVLRWLVVPFAILSLILLNALILYQDPSNKLFQIPYAASRSFLLFCDFGIHAAEKESKPKGSIYPLLSDCNELYCSFRIHEVSKRESKCCLGKSQAKVIAELTILLLFSQK